MDFFEFCDSVKWKTLTEAEALFQDRDDADALEAQGFLSLCDNLYTSGNELIVSLGGYTLTQAEELLRRAADVRGEPLSELGREAIAYAVADTIYCGGSVLRFYRSRCVRIQFSGDNTTQQEERLLALAKEVCTDSFAASLCCAYGRFYNGERTSDADTAGDSFAPFVTRLRSDTIKGNADDGDTYAVHMYTLLLRERKDPLSVAIRLLNIFCGVLCVLLAIDGFFLLLQGSVFTLLSSPIAALSSPIAAFFLTICDTFIVPVLGVPPLLASAVVIAILYVLSYLGKNTPKPFSDFIFFLGVIDYLLLTIIVAIHLYNYLSARFPEIFPPDEIQPKPKQALKPEPAFLTVMPPEFAILIVGLLLLCVGGLIVHILLHKREELLRHYDPEDTSGRGINKPLIQADTKKAERFFQKAYELDAEQGVEYARFLYRAKRKNEAKKILSLCIEQNSSNAMMAMRELFPFRCRSSELLHKAAGLENPDAILALSMEKSKPIAYIERAAELGSVEAMCWLSEKLSQGSLIHHIKKNPGRAFEYAQQAAASGSPDGLYQLGWCYEHGVGVRKQKEKAIQCYQNALKMGGNYSVATLRMILIGVFGHYDPLSEAAVSTEKDSDIQIERLVYQGVIKGTIRPEQIKSVYAELAAVSATQREELRRNEAFFTEYCIQQEEATKCAAQRISSDEYTQSEETLCRRFGDNWQRLCEDARICLVSARTMLHFTARYEARGFDYSGVSITASSALEYELKKVFFTPLIQRFQEKYCNRYDWPKAFFKKKKRDSEDALTDFTLGTLPYILGVNNPESFSAEQKRIVTDFLTDIIREEVYEKSVYSALTKPLFLPGFHSEKSFLDITEEIRDKYRNPAAHTVRVNRESAQSCYQVVAGVEDDLTKVESALEVLLFLLKS